MSKKKILLITQNEPIYLYENISILIETLPQDWKISHAVIGNQNPTGKKLSFFEKVLRSFMSLVLFFSFSIVFYSYFRR